MDEVKAKVVDVVILKRKLATNMEEGDKAHSCEPKKYKNIETLNGPECLKTIREIIKHGYKEEDADVVIEHKGQETLNDLIDFIFEVPTTKSEVEKLKKVISSRTSSTNRHIVIENVVIPSTASVSNEKHGGTEEESFQDLITGLQKVDGFQTEFWGSSIDTAATVFCPSENFTEEEKTLTMRQFLQDDDVLEEDDELNSTEVLSVQDRHCDTLESTFIRNENHEHTVVLNTLEENRNHGDSYKANLSNTPQQDKQVDTPPDTFTPSAHSASVEIGTDEYGKAVEESRICKDSEVNLHNAQQLNEQDVYADSFHSSDVEFCTDAYGDARIDMINEPNEITSDYVLEMVLAQASEVSTYAEQSHRLSENEISETQQLTTQEHENNFHNDVGVTEYASMQPSNSNGVKGKDETENVVVEQENANIDQGESSSTECSPTKEKETGENSSVASIASKTSSVTDCSVMLERVEDVLNPNKSKTGNPNVTSNGRKIVDATKLQRQVKDKWDAWKKTQEAQASNPSVVPLNCPTDTPSQVCTEANGNPQPETTNHDETSTREIDLEPSHSSDVQTGAVQERVDSRAIDENSNSQLNTTSTVDLPNERLQVDKIDNRQKKELKKVTYTQKQLLSMMKSEAMKEIPNMSLLSEWMEKSFENRKLKLVHPRYDLGKIVKMYPAMSLYQIVKEEYGRLLNDPKKMEKLEEKLMIEFDSVCKLKRRKFGKQHHLHEESKKRWKNNPNPELKKVLGMLCFAFHLAENAVVKSLCKLRSEDEEPKVRQMVTPTLDVCESQIFEPNTEMWIYVDAERYLKVPNFYEGVLCIYAIYWVYNIQYPPNLKLLLEFLDAMVGNPQTKYTGDIVKLF
ncbi:hypothetical protein Ocin01_15508 [Orchesella cincta]|uniref:Uncharacterized protein n=1 Tax=Orchesella cincta TaxID=48709 RepID=A0A1D2ME53_ORCCI|nr:hypothetical protein Ocin01_15508 [Orchesella cincta]